MSGAIERGKNPNSRLHGGGQSDRPVFWSELVTLLAPVVGVYLPLAGGTMLGSLLLNADPTLALEAATKNYVDNSILTKVDKAGDTMTGDLNMSLTRRVRNMADPLLAQDASTKNYTDTLIITKVDKSGDTMSGLLLFTNNLGLDVVGTGGSDILNIGTANADVINIGYSGSTVNVQGTLAYQNVVNYQVTDKLITINKGGAIASGVSSGFEIEENSSITGWFTTNGTRNGWELKAPASQLFTILTSGLTTSRTGTVQDSNGTFAWLTDIPSITGVTGRVAFYNGVNSTSSNANFLYDTTSGNLSVGTTTTTEFLNLGASTATKAPIRFDLGVNYTTLNAMTMWASSTSGANHFNFYDGNNHWKFGQLVGVPTRSALYLGTAIPSSTNYIIDYATGSSLAINAPSSNGQIILRVNQVTQFVMLPYSNAWTLAGIASGAITSYSWTTPANTTQTASAETIGVRFNMSATINHLVGNYATQRDFVINSRTHSFSGSSTITGDLSTLTITGAPINGTNANSTNSSAMLIQSNAVGGGVTNSFGLKVNAQTGATNNYAALFNGETRVDGDVKLLTPGNGLFIKEGVNATMGIATMVGGTVVVSTTKVTANSRVILTPVGTGVAQIGAGSVSYSLTAGVSFTIYSTDILDTRVVSWQIIEPS